MQYAISRNIPGEMIPKIDRTFNRGCQAFATLASFAKRREYDTALAFIASKPQSKDQTPRQKLYCQACGFRQTRCLLTATAARLPQ